jgi:hypothetical protein
MFGIKKPDVKQEISRYQSQRMRILKRLRDEQHGTITNVDLQRIAFNYTMRVSELRKDGHRIMAVYKQPGIWNYYYLGKTDDKAV